MSAYDGQRSPANVASPFGRRLGWYAVARAIKPRLIVETGVERGHGALLLCAALLRNGEEGAPGHYLGTDINPGAGYLLSGKYKAAGKILYGDSIMSLREISEPELISLSTTATIQLNMKPKNTRRSSPSCQLPQLFWVTMPMSPTSWLGSHGILTDHF